MKTDRPFAWRILIAGQVATSLVAITALIDLPTRLVWNASASVPIGLYAVTPIRSLELSQLVLVMPPEPVADFLYRGGYVGKGVPLLKRIEAMAGQQVCRIDGVIRIDGVVVAEAREHDRWGRGLPVWSGCRVLRTGEVFLLNRDQPASLDGRYFGPLATTTIVGRASPLWIREPG